MRKLETREMLKINAIRTLNLLTKTKLPVADFTINPYVGCQHNCIYCYTDFMKRFTNHKEPWGSFVDIKVCDKKIRAGSLIGKTVQMSSVTDAYMPIEKDAKATRMVLEQLLASGASVSILTKNAMVLRDMDLFKKFKNIEIAMSMNTLDDKFRRDIEPAASPIGDRINALETLRANNIPTGLFISPMFPGITDYKKIIERCRAIADSFWFENLNLYPGASARIIKYIKIKFPKLADLYNRIYVLKDVEFWEILKDDIINYCNANDIKYRMYFYHKQIVAKAISSSHLKLNT